MLIYHTLKWTNSANDKKRFVAEYAQGKIRYEHLKDVTTKIEAHESWGLGYTVRHDCPLSLLHDQQRALGQYLHTLELEAAIKHIDLDCEIHKMIEDADKHPVSFKYRDDEDRELEGALDHMNEISPEFCIMESGK